METGVHAKTSVLIGECKHIKLTELLDITATSASIHTVLSLKLLKAGCIASSTGLQQQLTNASQVS